MTINQNLFKFEYNGFKDCHFQVSRYTENNNLAIAIYDDEGMIANVTTNPGVGLIDDYIAVKDYSENEGMMSALAELGIIVSEPALSLPSGFVFIPVCALTDEGMEILKKRSVLLFDVFGKDIPG